MQKMRKYASWGTPRPPKKLIIQKQENRLRETGGFLLCKSAQSNGMPFLSQNSIVSRSHTLDCTSPMCAHSIMSMHRRD